MKPPKPPTIYAAPEQVRRKLAASYAKLASGKRFTAVERAEFARMAEAWGATLPKE